MKGWLVEPRDPLVIRDGRPPAAGMPQAQSLEFPWPSTVAGLARTQAGKDTSGRFDSTRIDELLAKKIAGPWLVELDETGAAFSTAFPAPRDAVPFRNDDGSLDLRRLSPGEFPLGSASSLPNGLHHLALGGSPSKTKPTAGPAFWRWRELEPWLLEGRAPAAGFGIRPLAHERRFHVSIDAATSTAADGKLFVSDGLRFWSLASPHADSHSSHRLAIGFATSDDLSLAVGPVKLGGEGRVSYLRAGNAAVPACPTGLLAKLERTRKVRVVLATPALFDGGAWPNAKTLFGERVIAMRVERPEVTSGWDYAKGQPKPSRRMASAGSVYWLELSEKTDARQWLAAAWGNPVTEQAEQDQRDGFGLALLGVGT